mgnify:CR=1 FL=1
MIQRQLGNTDASLSVVGFGGIVVMNEEQSAADRLVGQAVDRGINYFDVAPSYGNAEDRLGPALVPYRDGVFLACKTGKRTRTEAAAELRQSLKRLKTDHVDLYQFHAVSTQDDVDRIFAEDGAMAAVIEGRDRGLLRHIGFSAHTEEAALAMLERFDFDTILFPVNWVCWLKGGFGPRVMEAAAKKGVGILALKALAKRKWGENETRTWSKAWYAPVETPEEAADGLRFTLSKPVTAAVSPGHAELLWWACDAADDLDHLTEADHQRLAQKAQALTPIFNRANS